jgi:hypothetical protein
MSDLLRAVIVEEESVPRELLHAMLDDSDRVEVVGAAGGEIPRTFVRPFRGFMARVQGESGHGQ